ncbi:MAG: hypothetical protein ACOCXQ_03895 [Patescibacteria group bacterium]
MENQTVFDNAKEQEQREAYSNAVRRMTGYRIAFFLTVLILIVSLMGNAYLFYYLNQVDKEMTNDRMARRQTDNGLIPPETTVSPEETGNQAGGEDGEAASGSDQPNLTEVPSDEAQKEFISEPYSLSFMYPADWQMKTDGQFFESGDIVQVYQFGESQREATEISDGALLSVMEPVETNQDVEVWIKENYNTTDIPREGEPVELATTEIQGRTYHTAYTCGLGCLTYYHTKENGKIYGFVTLSAGPSEEQYSQDLEQILQTITITAE